MSDENLLNAALPDDLQDAKPTREVTCSRCGKTGDSETGLWCSDDMVDLCWSCWKQERDAVRLEEKAWDVFARLAADGSRPSPAWCFALSREFIAETKRQREKS